MTKQTVTAAFVVGALAVAGSAMAQDIKIGIGIPLSPGQTGTSPGQLYNAARAAPDSTALPPGRFYIQNRTNVVTPALPPGQNVVNPGKKK